MALLPALTAVRVGGMAGVQWLDLVSNEAVIRLRRGSLTLEISGLKRAKAEAPRRFGSADGDAAVSC